MQKTDEKKEEADTRQNDHVGQALIEKMFKVGAHYGYSKTRRHPSLAKYIYATKNKGDIIDLEKTSEMLDNAAKFMKKLGAFMKKRFPQKKL